MRRCVVLYISSEEQNIAEWSSSVARRAHNPKVVGSNPSSATIKPPVFGRFFLARRGGHCRAGSSHEDQASSHCISPTGGRAGDITHGTGKPVPYRAAIYRHLIRRASATPSPQGEGSRSPWRASRSYEPESVPAKTSQPLSQPTADSSPYTGEPMGCAEKYFPALMSRGSFTVFSVAPTPGTGNIRIRDCPNAPQKKQKTAAEAAAFCFGEIERIYAGRKRESPPEQRRRNIAWLLSRNA